jgi:hypothetical protein
MKPIILAIALLSAPLHAQHAALAADAATTAAALSAGAVELNPIGWAAVPIRLGLIEAAKSLPDEERVPVYHMMNASGYGAAANNIGVFMGLQGAPVFGLMVGIGIWAGGREEREFFRACATHRAYFKRQLPCKYTPGPVAAVRQEVAP